MANLPATVNDCAAKINKPGRGACQRGQQVRQSPSLPERLEGRGEEGGGGRGRGGGEARRGKSRSTGHFQC